MEKATTDSQPPPNSLIPSSTTGLIKVSGADALSFLQGQLTCDVQQLANQHSQIGGYCNVQGRLICVFRISRIDNDFYLQMPQEIVENTISKLKKYRLRSKVTLTDLSQEWENVSTLCPALSPTFNPLLNIKTGIPTIYSDTQEMFLPHRLNLHLLGGIGFNKGCYVGQEIIARMHYRSTLKHHMYRVSLQTQTTLTRGASLQDMQNNEVGKLVDYYLVAPEQYEALAVLTIETATTLKTQPGEIYINLIASKISIEPLPYNIE